MRKRLLNQLFKQIGKTLSKNPKQLAVVLSISCIMAGLWYAYEVNIARPAMSYMGVPHETSGHATHFLNHTLRNKAYMVGYSEKLKNPLWVTYKITDQKMPYGKRPHFSADWRSLSGITSSDYRGSGFDRGHLAPNYVIGSRYGVKAQTETFLMTNISPQKSNLNQKSWQRLESVAADYFTKKFPEFWVVTGPIFSEDPKLMKQTSIAIPEAFYKIFIVPGSEQQAPHVLAMRFPQTARPNASLIRFVTSVDEIEAQTGLDFFSQLPDDIENNIEKGQNYQAWGLKKVARTKNRY